MKAVLEAYWEFDRRRHGWVKVRLSPSDTGDLPVRGHASEAVRA
jgi:hypothetical protein